MYLTIHQREALQAIKERGTLVNNREFTSWTLNSLVDKGLLRIITGTRGKSRKCQYALTPSGKDILL
jgi:hypothetical protein